MAANPENAPNRSFPLSQIPQEWTAMDDYLVRDEKRLLGLDEVARLRAMEDTREWISFVARPRPGALLAMRVIDWLGRRVWRGRREW